ncbi:MAG: N-acetylmuramoyl-L-alanine amidase domain protein [Parcubacteria group bacterium GW2011_GWB1_40_14]|nr:MAG: N-acetylmuramoyl-L-alanine amidase domain protein [Parcubacteria group bacterium GW2011_GWB1_40_14]
MSSYNIGYLIKKRLVLSLSKGFATAFAVAILFLNSQAQAADIDPSVLDTTSSSGPGTVISGNNFTAEGVPVILPRSTWENTDELRAMMTWFPEESHIPPDYASVERIVVHDLGCRLSSPACNSDSTNPISLIQAVYRFHAITYGWEDIGYNYIIDRQGRIYEGRFGGNGTRGAHLYHSRKCQNFNINTVGIMLLGNYAATPMPQAMEDSLARLSAWLAVVNGFEPSAVSTSEIWENPRNIEGKCDISSGAYSTTFTGPTVLSHGDIEAGNSDFFDFTLLRTKAQNFANTYKNLFYKTTNSSDIFSLSSGAARKMVSASADKIVAISETQLHLFPSETLAKFADGTLIRSASRGRIYKVEAEKRRDILNEEIFKFANFKWEDIKIVSDRELILYPFGEPIPYPDGTLVKDEKGSVYKFEGEKLRYITSLNLYAKGQPLVYPDGTLITSNKIIKGVSNTIYKVESGQRRPISSQTLFIKLKLSTKNIKKISDTEMSFYPVGQYVNWPGGTLLRSSNDTKVWYIQSGFKRWIQDGNVLKALGFSWNSINIVSADEISSYQEAQHYL